MRFVALAPLLTACVAVPQPTVEQLGACGAAIVATPILDSPHVPYGAPIVWPVNPPTSGTHWSVWAGWDRAYVDLPRGLWLHGAEHGGIILLSRCRDCPDFDRLVDVARARPTDAHCEPPLRHRIIVTSDPLLPDGVAVAAIAWGVAYTAACVDPTALHAFIDEHYGRAAENTCADGAPLDGIPFGED